MRLTGVAFCVLFFAFQHIPEIIYVSFLKRPYDPYAPKNLWDFWIWVCFFSFIWWTYRINLYGTW